MSAPIKSNPAGMRTVEKPNAEDEELIDLIHSTVRAAQRISAPFPHRNTDNQCQRPAAIHQTYRAESHAAQAVTADEHSLPASRNRVDSVGPQRRGSRSVHGQTNSPPPPRAASPTGPTSIHAFAQSRNHLSMSDLAADGYGSSETAPCQSPADVLARRRMTLTELVAVTEAGQSDMTETLAENDVCYPQDDQPEDKLDVDWQTLQDYVAQRAAAAAVVSTAEPSVSGLTANDSSSSVSKKEMEYMRSSEKPVELNDRRYSKYSTKPLPSSSYTFFSSLDDDVVHSQSLGGLLADGQDFKSLFSLRDNQGCWWLDIVRPSDDEVAVLSKAFGVHPLTREDITTQESREKVELFKHYYFVSFRSFESNKGKSEKYLGSVHVYAVVFGNGLITFSHSPNHHASNVLRRIGKLRDFMSISSNWICYAIIDDIVDSFMPVIHDVNAEVDIIEDSVFTSRNEDARLILISIGKCRRKVMSVLRLLGGKPDVIKGFAKRCTEQYSIAPTGDIGLYLSDIQDHVVTVRDNLSHSEQLLSRIHANFLAQINVEHIEGGNKTNTMLGKVTLLATILVPMNLITGLFGMNVEVPGKEQNGLVWFFGICSFLLAFALICLFVFRKMRLI